MRNAAALPPPIRWIVDAGKKETDTIGFLPTASLIRHWDAGQIIFANDEELIAGYILHGPLRPGAATQIHQLLVAKEQRRQGIGRSLVTRLAARARNHNVSALVLNCGIDLAAMHFWSAIGFEQAYTRPGGERRHRIIARFAKEIGPTGTFARRAQNSIAQDAPRITRRQRLDP